MDPKTLYYLIAIAMIVVGLAFTMLGLFALAWWL